MKRLLLALLVPLFVACAPATTSERTSPFPIASEPRSFPTWRATAPAFERMLLAVLKTTNPNFADAFARDLQGQAKMREVQSARLEQQRTAIMFLEEADTIVLGVLNLEHPRQGAFAISLERAIAEAADKLFVRVVFGQVTRASQFAGFFPYDSAGRDLPVWATGIETALPVMIEAIKGSNLAYQDANGSELTDTQSNDLRIFQIRGSSLERERIEVYVVGEAQRVALGVFEAGSGGRPVATSHASKLEAAVVAAMDGLYQRSPD